VTLLLDTHAWIWWASESPKLSRRARTAAAKAARLGVSAISCWEVAMLVKKGRLELDRDVETWISQALALPRVELVAISPAIAVAAASFDRFHGDPADRLIAASALAEGARLVTRDEGIRGAGVVDCLW
jgi:PIN domain nuclease of toxin-antitoxin system